MPFICLANANVLDGVLQITDLWPNVSQDNNPTNPPGQTRYLRRPGSDTASVNLTTGLVEGAPAVSNQPNFDGLGAYIADKVEPGSLEQATADITILLQPVAGDTLLIAGLIYVEFTAGASDATTAATVGDPLLVNIKGTAALSADELTVVMTDAAAIVTMRGLNANIYPDVSNALGVVTMDAAFTGGGAQLGATGDMALRVTSGGVRYTLPIPARLARASEAWDATTLATTVAAVLTRLDAGTADMNLAGINTALTAGADAELTGAAASSASVGTVLEFLAVLAGRTYRLPTATLKFAAVTAPDTVHAWSATLRGAFTEANTTWDTDMLSGEWGATTAGRKALKTGGSFLHPTFLETPAGAAGGDVVNNEVAGARATFHSTAFTASVANGQLSQYANGVTLFPDPEVQAFAQGRVTRGGVWLTPLQRQAPLTNQRIVTVYDDDGTLLV